jgi:hypothetical protein
MSKRIRADICPYCGGTVLAPERLSVHIEHEHPERGIEPREPTHPGPRRWTWSASTATRTEALDVLREDALIPLLLSCVYDMPHVTTEDVRVLSYRLAQSPVRLAAKETP